MEVGGRLQGYMEALSRSLPRIMVVEDSVDKSFWKLSPPPNKGSSHVLPSMEAYTSFLGKEGNLPWKLPTKEPNKIPFISQ